VVLLPAWQGLLEAREEEFHSHRSNSSSQGGPLGPEMAWLCSPGWPQTQDPPASVSQVLEIQACTTLPSPSLFFKLIHPSSAGLEIADGGIQRQHLSTAASRPLPGALVDCCVFKPVPLLAFVLRKENIRFAAFLFPGKTP
jgi:hypothetical protein